MATYRDLQLWLKKRYPYIVNKRATIKALSTHAEDIRSFGVAHLYLFGSTVRGKTRGGSDVDVFVDLKKDARVSLFEMMDLKDCLGRLLRAPVDVFPREGLHRVIRADVERAAARVF
ncbi:MAG: nucleotidyltransferase domain-containing protein [Pseudomonadota bacterium]